MKIVKENERINEKTAVALGFFDGVHIGHRAILKSCAKERCNALIPAVFTFKENPIKVSKRFFSGQLISFEQKVKLMEDFGIDYVYAPNFISVRELSAQDFVKKVLKEKLNAKKVFCGFNFHFGKDASADSTELKKLCEKYDINIEIIPPVKLSGAVVSSSLVRKELENANIKRVNQLLGYVYSINFEVTSGNKIGRKIGIPTLNQPYPKDFQLPKFGAYASYIKYNGNIYPSLTNIGVKPTVGSEYPLAETWVPDCDLANLYGKKINVSLIEFIREERKFDSLESLKEEVMKNSKYAKKVFETYKERGNMDV